MLLRRTTQGEQHAAGTKTAKHEERQLAEGDHPLTCMFYFFASQMARNTQPADQDLVRRGRIEDKSAHQLDSMIARLGMQAAFSPLIQKFDTHPTEIPNLRPEPTRRDTLAPSAAEVHDTVLIVKFRDKRVRQDWIAMKEWQNFMQKTEVKDVFRRVPLVRCASSVRGLMDPVEILTA